MPEIFYIGMQENHHGGWTTHHRVDVYESDWEERIRNLNGPQAGEGPQCLLGLLLHPRQAETYRQRRVTISRPHSIQTRSRPRVIRVYRALKPYHTATGAPRTIRTLPLGGGIVIPWWVLAECETLEFRLYYWDEDGVSPVHSSLQALEVWVPWKRRQERESFWFYRIPPGLHVSDGNFIN